MAFTVTDFADLTRLLDAHPEWQAELRRLILSEDFLALPGIVQELAAAQQRTEIELRKLAEAQQRTDERLETLAMRVEELAEAQQRTDERLETLAMRVEELAAQVHALAEAQQRTEAQVRELTKAQWRTEQRLEGLSEAVGGLQRAFGATIEEEAESFVLALLEEKGYRLLAKPYSLALDGQVDVVVPLKDPTGETVWAVVEAKARLSYREVRGWGQRMHSSGWHKRLAAEGVAGPYLVYAYGIRVDPGAVATAEEQGIGLLTGRGEQVPPEGLIR